MHCTSEAQCDFCDRISKHRLVWVGYGFQFQCPHCQVLHCDKNNFCVVAPGEVSSFFSNSLLTRKNMNFDKQFCIGYRTKDSQWRINEESKAWKMNGVNYVKNCLDGVDRVLNASPQPTEIKIIRASNNDLGKPHFIVNVNEVWHYQHRLRAAFCMKLHLLDSQKKSSTYNLMILPEQWQFLIEKFPEVDEFWVIPDFWYAWWKWDKAVDSTWPGTAEILAGVGQKINEMLSSRGAAECFSETGAMALTPHLDINLKTNGLIPSIRNQLLKEIVTDGNPIFSENGDKLVGKKYVGILPHHDQTSPSPIDSRWRAGLHSQNQLQEACDLVLAGGLQPMVIKIGENSNLNTLDQGMVLNATQLTTQGNFFSNHCCGVIGSNNSGLNIPTLFELPILALSKWERPSDFLNFGGLLWRSQIDIPVQRNVCWIIVPQTEPTSLLRLKSFFDLWLQRVVNGQTIEDLPRVSRLS